MIKNYSADGIELSIDFDSIEISEGFEKAMAGLIEIQGDQLIIRSKALADQIREQLAQIDHEIK